MAEVNVSSYNCGGFALETYDWYMFESEDHNDYWLGEKLEEAQNEFEEGVDQEVIYEQLLNWCREVLLASFPNYKEITAPDCAAKSSRVVGFRWSHLFEDCPNFEDLDFHFICRVDGEWLEKHGGKEIRHCEFDPVNDAWTGSRQFIYDGKILWMEKVG